MVPKPVDEIDYNLLSQIFEKVKQIYIVQNAMFSKINELNENIKMPTTVEDKEEQKKNWVIFLRRKE